MEGKRDVCSCNKYNVVADIPLEYRIYFIWGKSALLDCELDTNLVLTLKLLEGKCDREAEIERKPNMTTVRTIRHVQYLYCSP